MFARVETRFFQLCGFLNMSIHLDVFSNHLVLTGSSQQFPLKNWFLLSKILLQLEYSIDIRQLTLENVARVYSDYNLKCARRVLLPLEPPSHYYCCNSHNSRNRRPWINFFIDAGMSLCHYANPGVDKWPFHLNS